ncbi:hypothetical protein PLEOSDRAFT_1100738 [Pleurotus ostreatus PC15]|uniref:Uncharacterized protein n=1 Tax=Pleurotus ostreatus (strain PC15) TaxID=1137138 RepID=A0A067NVZ6_PLEO1|nr:hypothetical protein PLEOSDRAFT_1100738 [Pleurotus ostreatus PC15]
MNGLPEEKNVFAISLLPWYRTAVKQHEEGEFFSAVWLLLFDRFPSPPGDPMTPEYQLTTRIEMDEFELAVMIYGFHPDYRDVPPSKGDWRPHIELPADRKRRRKEWQARNAGEPTEHQYIVAFEDYDDLILEAEYTDLEGYLYY